VGSNPENDENVFREIVGSMAVRIRTWAGRAFFNEVRQTNDKPPFCTKRKIARGPMVRGPQCGLHT
jgi:hypothetical protein